MRDFATERSVMKSRASWDYGAETLPDRVKHILSPSSFRVARRAFPYIRSKKNVSCRKNIPFPNGKSMDKGEDKT